VPKRNIIQTKASVQDTLEDLKPYIQRLGISLLDFSYKLDPDTNEASISFRKGGQVYQKSCSSQKTLSGNFRALFVWFKGRVVNYEREIETFDEAFGSHLLPENARQDPPASIK
jgi:hypothetical protein